MTTRPANPDPVVIGRIGGAYGVKGWVRVVSFTEPPENIERYRPWLVGDGADWRAVEVDSVRAHGDGFVARIGAIADRDAAQRLAGSLIAVSGDALPPIDAEDEYYWRDLVGLRVEDSAGALLGRVDHLLDTGAHDLLVIRDGDRERLIPFLKTFVIDVDLDAGRLVVEWQEPV